MGRGRKRAGKVVAKKMRVLWGINPRTRVHDERGYRRARAKAAGRGRIREELDQGDV